MPYNEWGEWIGKSTGERNDGSPEELADLARNNAAWGTAGPLNQNRSYDQLVFQNEPASEEFVTIGGKEYARVGPDEDVSGYERLGFGRPQIIQNAQYGPLIDANIKRAANEKYKSEMKDKRGPLGGAVNAFMSTIGPALGFTAAMGALGVGAAGGAAGNVGAADVAGLTQMAADAGLTGAAADAFVASGGTMGSTTANALTGGQFMGGEKWGANLRPAEGTSALSGITDPINAIEALDSIGGGQGATAGAAALGFDSVPAALASVNPAWASPTGLMEILKQGGSVATKLLGGGTAAQLLGTAATIGAGAYGAGAANNAAQAQIDATKESIAEQRRQYDTTRADNAPFLATGTAANARLKGLLGLDPAYTGSDAGSLTRKFTDADMQADPVYQSGLKFGLDEGTKGVNARAISSGMYDSGATLKALTRYGTDYAGTKGNEAYNRYASGNSDIYNKLAGVSGAGQVAASQVANAGQSTTNAISADLTGAGNARAAGIVGGANAWGGAAQGINSAFNNANSNAILERLLMSRGY